MHTKLYQFVLDNNGNVVNNSIPGYEFLENGEQWAVFENPNDSEDMMVRIGDSHYFLFFGQWFEKFAKCDEGVDALLEVADNIMNDRSYLWQIQQNGQRILSLVTDEPGTFYEMAKKEFMATINGKEFFFDPQMIDTSFIFWDPMMMEKVTKTPYLN